MNSSNDSVESDARGEVEASSLTFSAYERHMAVAVLCSDLAHGIAPATTFLREMLRDAEMGAIERSIGEEELARLKAFVASLRRTRRHEASLRSIDVARAIGNAVDRARLEGFDTARTVVKSERTSIRAEERALELAVLSLLRNAFEAAPEGVVSVSTHVEGDRLRIEVTDGGRGLPEPLVDTAFYPLAALGPNGRGTGLAIVLRIVRDHGWDVSYARREGRTVFLLEIPLGVR